MPGCRNCGKPVEGPRNPIYCSGRCRAAASRKRRDQGVREALDQAERALEKARSALGGKEGKR